jgi:putative oxidoreductase
MPDISTVLNALAPFTEALLRVFVGLALVPHALRNTFGYFRGTGQPLTSMAMLAGYLDEQGYRPGRLWAPLISAVQLIGGPLLALGLFTRWAALPILCFLLVADVERWRVGKYFWNQLGIEYTLMWTLAVFYFLANGGGPYSLDHLLFGG